MDWSSFIKHKEEHKESRGQASSINTKEDVKGILSIPYSRIDSIGLYVKGFWNRAHVLEIRTKGKTYELEFKRGTDCQGVYRWLSCLICE